jgi:hypothetical protein
VDRLIRGQINGKFTGWSGNTLFRLTNGQFWVQKRYAYHYHYAYRPSVVIEQIGGRWIMKVAGIQETVEVAPVTGFVAQVRGAFKGWVGSTEVELTNGQMWKQIQYHYHYQYSYMPEAVVYQGGAGSWMMSVADSPTVEVKRIR